MHILLKPHRGLWWQPQLKVLEGFKAKSLGVPSWAHFALWLGFWSAAGDLGVFSSPLGNNGLDGEISPSPPWTCYEFSALWEEAVVSKLSPDSG